MHLTEAKRVVAVQLLLNFICINTSNFCNIMSSIQDLDHLQIPLEDIKLATNNFSNGNFIGEGGFGRVYKGQLSIPTASGTSSGTTVAIKRLDVKGGQGPHEFLMEIVMLASYKHDNLVSLFGFCEEGDEKIIIYKHEARGSLDAYLATDLPWLQRLKICLGAARGLDFLHTGAGMGHRVLHRDIKSSNVLLDENWEAKISDFGLSKIGPTNQQFTLLVTNVAGTFGYVDPLYISTGFLTKESDVYSFGVVLFEVLCGRLAMDIRYEDERRFLSHLAQRRYEEGKLHEIVLPHIREQIKLSSLQTFSSIAIKCLKTDRKQRPTMAEIIEQLQMSFDFQMGIKREYTQTELWGSATGGSPWSLHLDSNQKLRKITINHEDWIYFIGFTTEDFRGLLDSSRREGGSGPFGARVSEVNFDIDEEIIGIDVTVGVSTGLYPNHVVISSLFLTTNKKRHGPFGKETATRFSARWDVGSFIGFFGRAGYYLDGLGCYLTDTVVI